MHITIRFRIQQDQIIAVLMRMLRDNKIRKEIGRKTVRISKKSVTAELRNRLESSGDQFNLDIPYDEKDFEDEATALAKKLFPEVKL